MHEIEKWIKDLYNKRFRLDTDSVIKFIRDELHNSPLEDPNNSMNVIQGVVKLYSSSDMYYLKELIDYQKELMWKKENEK